MAEATKETLEIIANYKEYAKAMFDADSAYSKAKAEMTETFNQFGLSGPEFGQVLAQTLAQMTVQTNSEALKTAQATVLLSQDVLLKIAQTSLVTRQEKGYDDNLLVKTAEFQSAVTQFAVNAGGEQIQESVNLLNAKIAQVEHRVADLIVVDPVDSVVSAPVMTVGTVTTTTIPLSWLAIDGASEYTVWVDGVARAGTSNLYTELDSLTPDTNYALNIQALVNGTLSRMSTTVIVKTNA